MQILEDSYYPLPVAAEMAGYSPRHVRRLVLAGKVRHRSVRGQLHVHLGSLVAWSKSTCHYHERTPLEYWLIATAPIKRQILSSDELAILASHDLRMRISQTAVCTALERLSLVPQSDQLRTL